MSLVIEVERGEKIEIEATAPAKGTLEVTRRRDHKVWIAFDCPKTIQIRRQAKKKEKKD